ncbi:MLO protein1 [Sesamum alatum]|uniref:MLO protein1 n=1 Tax=Sesamum alatum TaxID=300844 RepID=A0AAE1YQ46_9LAMI|nr:MLO protein1 [Sesamum alatum]
MAAGSGPAERSLEQTSTWAVALVCAVFVIISIVIEHGIQSLGKICVSKELGDKWLPCDKGLKNDDGGDDGKGKKGHRKLLSYAQELVWRRALAAGSDQYDYCTAKGKVSLISYSGVHQLHVFIFVLAVMHVLYSVILVGLGHAKNAYQMAYFLWKWYEFGITTCFHEKLFAILIRVSLGVALQILCSYITFPLYTLVTQMGSHMKKSIFEEQTAKALKKWHQAAKQRKKMRKAGTGAGASNAGFMSGETTPTQGSSPLHLLHNYKHRSSGAPDTDSLPLSPRSYASDSEISELDGSSRGK